MSRVCELTGIHPLTGHKVSHSNIKSKKISLPNLRKVTCYIPEMKRNVSLTLSTRALRTINKHMGLMSALLATNDKLLSARLVTLKKSFVRMKKSAQKAAPKKAPAAVTPTTATPKAPRKAKPKA